MDLVAKLTHRVDLVAIGILILRDSLFAISAVKFFTADISPIVVNVAIA